MGYVYIGYMIRFIEIPSSLQLSSKIPFFCHECDFYPCVISLNFSSPFNAFTGEFSEFASYSQAGGRFVVANLHYCICSRASLEYFVSLSTQRGRGGGTPNAPPLNMPLNIYITIRPDRCLRGEWGGGLRWAGEGRYDGEGETLGGGERGTWMYFR